MCRSVPGRVLAVDGEVATVDFWGTQQVVRLELVDEPVAPGDHVLCHRGYAMQRVPPGDVAEMMAFYEQLLAADVEG
jgi:hydrogenase expression/formation protein HypC